MAGRDRVRGNINAPIRGSFDDATAGRTITTINKALAGHNAALSDNYGLSVDDLGELMRRWREHAAAS